MRARWLAALLAARLCSPRRPPDFVVGDGPVPYLRRWWLLPRNPLLNAYLHHFMRSDDDRALHDHPWPSLSLTLSGEMLEFRFARGLRAREDKYNFDMATGFPVTHAMTERRISAGSLRFRSPWCKHRLELVPGAQCWTLFITGPTVRSWGFWCEGVRFVNWRRFTDTRDGKSVTGRGCE